MTALTETPTLTVVDDAGGMPDVQLALDLATNTPADVLEHLIDEGRIPRATPQGERHTYLLAYGDRRLVNDEPLGAQGVEEGKALRLLRDMKKGVRA